MSLPPLNPDKSTAGIILDPTTLERVVPSSRRKDGTTRKELKIRPGFTPQEDVGRFRGSRQTAADARAGFVPGSNNRPAPPKQPNPENPFAQGPAAPKSKAQVKNEKRRAAKRSAATVEPSTTKAWDEMDSSDEDVDEGKEEEEEEEKPVPAEEAYPPPGSGGAPLDNAISPTPPDPSGSLSPTEAALSNAPAVSPSGIAGPASAAYSSEATEKAWKAATPPPGSRTSSRPSTGRTPHSSSSTSASANNKSATASADKGKAPRHPIQGGRQGPIGLAHPPPAAPPKNTKADFPALGGSKGPAKKTEPEQPRVRKEVKVREGGANDVGSLSARLRGMVLANASQESPRQRRERVASEASKEDGSNGGGAAAAA